jgi:hypothetical protein
MTQAITDILTPQMQQLVLLNVQELATELLCLTQKEHQAKPGIALPTMTAP